MSLGKPGLQFCFGLQKLQSSRMEDIDAKEIIFPTFFDFVRNDKNLNLKQFLEQS